MNKDSKTHRRIHSSSEHSTSSGTQDSLRQRPSTPSISFSASEGVKLDLDAQSGSSERGNESINSSRRSVDGSESEPPDLREKCFEKSLNTILDKCSEPSVDLTLDSSRSSKSVEETPNPVKPTGKTTERKKKSVPWYTVS